MRALSLPNTLPVALLTLGLSLAADRFHIEVILPGGASERVDVTVENGPQIDLAKRVYGKGNQLRVDAEDFPTLARTGLHSEAELDATKTITGRPIEEITRIAQAGVLSGAGFLAPDEDILSVLRADNRTVAKLGLTHRQLAEPIFHLWNLELWAFETGRIGRFVAVDHILYRGRRVTAKIQSSRGWQESVFNDEIRGNSHFEITREPSKEETAFLSARYPRERLATVLARLSSIQTGEMVAYYIMRYGFYEGHTAFRADPLAIAFIFGLRTLEELEAAFPGALDAVLTQPAQVRRP